MFFALNHGGHGNKKKAFLQLPPEKYKLRD